MGEVAAISQQFELEFHKALSSLPAPCSPDQHDAYLLRTRLTEKLSESIAYYNGRLPAYAGVPRVLACGEKLAKAGSHRLALEACYQRVRNMALHAAPEGSVPRMSSEQLISAHVQACYGTASCEAALLLVADPQIKHPDTLKGLVAQVADLKTTLTLVLPHERLYWLTLNGTVHAYTICSRLMTAGFAQQAAPLLAFCVRSLEGHVSFAVAK